MERSPTVAAVALLIGPRQASRESILVTRERGEHGVRGVFGQNQEAGFFSKVSA